MPIIKIKGAENVTLSNISQLFKKVSNDYGVPITIGYDTIKIGGLFSSSKLDCITISNSEHLNDYYKLCISVTYQGNVAFVEINDFGYSPQMEKAARAEFAKQDRKGKSLSYKIGSKIGESISNIGKNANKLDAERQYYSLLTDIINDVFQ